MVPVVTTAVLQFYLVILALANYNERFLFRKLKWRNFFFLCSVPLLASAQSFCKGAKSSGKFR